jgi:dTDP-4-dehydrorhamnose reductase
MTTWYGFARAILEGLRIDKRVVPVATNEYPRPAMRPANSGLDSGKLERDLGIVLPDWRHALKLCVGDFRAGRQSEGK